MPQARSLMVLPNGPLVHLEAVAVQRLRSITLRLRIPRLFLQVLGHLGGGDGAFADCGGDAFD